MPARYVYGVMICTAALLRFIDRYISVSTLTTFRLGMLLYFTSRQELLVVVM